LYGSGFRLKFSLEAEVLVEFVKGVDSGVVVALGDRVKATEVGTELGNDTKALARPVKRVLKDLLVGLLVPADLVVPVPQKTSSGLPIAGPPSPYG
jgi:hypothetical protein